MAVLLELVAVHAGDRRIVLNKNNARVGGGGLLGHFPSSSGRRLSGGFEHGKRDSRRRTLFGSGRQGQRQRKRAAPARGRIDHNVAPLLPSELQAEVKAESGSR